MGEECTVVAKDATAKADKTALRTILRLVETNRWWWWSVLTLWAFKAAENLWMMHSDPDDAQTYCPLNAENS